MNNHVPVDSFHRTPHTHDQLLMANDDTDDGYYTLYAMNVDGEDRLFHKTGTEPSFCPDCGTHKVHHVLVGSYGERRSICARRWAKWGAANKLARVKVRSVHPMSVITDVHDDLIGWPEALEILEREWDPAEALA